tara:strand:+ start:279 stop:512 length:234 start_codon:yes stop_codon:yes gene_type:complete
MTLSQQVEDSLTEASSNLRNALAYAARTEKSYVSKHIADMILRIDSLMDAVDLMEKIENRHEGESGRYGPFFHMDEE